MADEPTPFSRRVEGADERAATVEVNRVSHYAVSGAPVYAITLEMDNDGYQVVRFSEKQVLKLLIAMADALKTVNKVSRAHRL